MYFLLNMGIFYCYVSLPECNSCHLLIKLVVFFAPQKWRLLCSKSHPNLPYMDGNLFVFAIHGAGWDMVNDEAGAGRGVKSDPFGSDFTWKLNLKECHYHTSHRMDMYGDVWYFDP